MGRVLGGDHLFWNLSYRHLYPYQNHGRRVPRPTYVQNRFHGPYHWEGYCNHNQGGYPWRHPFQPLQRVHHYFPSNLPRVLSWDHFYLPYPSWRCAVFLRSFWVPRLHLLYLFLPRSTGPWLQTQRYTRWLLETLLHHVTFRVRHTFFCAVQFNFSTRYRDQFWSLYNYLWSGTGVRIYHHYGFRWPNSHDHQFQIYSHQ